MSQNFEPALTKGIIFSDGVIREEGTRKNSFLGSFQVYNLIQFPAPVPPFFVTPLITNLTPDVKEFNIVVRIENPTNGMVLASTASHIAFPAPPDRNETFEVPMVVFNLAFPSAGLYKATVLVNNELVGERVLYVKDARAPSPS
jgi:hypothetical protein